MKNKLYTLNRSLWLLLLIAIGLVAQAQTPPGAQTVPGVIRIKLKENSNVLQRIGSAKMTASGTQPLSIGVETFDALNTKYSAQSMKRVFPHGGKFEDKQRKHGLHLWYEVTIDKNSSVTAAAREYGQVAEVSLSKPVYKKVFEEGEPKSITLPPDVEGMPFNDPFLKIQWHYNNRGQSNGTLGADMKAFEAWEITAGTPNVIVAVVDGGIDTDHEDLVDNLWTNTAELMGEEGVDDDGNGFVDDIHGYNFVNDQGRIVPHYHGTHVAGTVAATNNNGRGVAGVAGGTGNGDGARLMSTQVFTDYDGGNFAAAIAYGANNGAVISQNSWGYTVPDLYEPEVLAAINYFIEEAGQYPGSPMKGGVVIFAAGNDDSPANYYPGAYPSVITVASTQHDNDKAYYSNYGQHIDISAPGGDYANDYFGGILSTFPGHGYGMLQGTSMACPHVSGVAALIVSKFGGEDFTNEMLEYRLLGSAIPHTNALHPYYQGQMGFGTLNAINALKEDKGILPAKAENLTVKEFDYHNRQAYALVEWNASEDLGNGKPFAYEVYRSGTPFTAEDYFDLAPDYTFPSSDTASTVNYKLFGALGYTRYIAVVAIDMFGKKSELSEVLEVTFPSKPAANIPTTPITMSVDVTANTTGSTSFEIGNTVDSTTLVWDTFLTHLSVSNAAATALSYPQAADPAIHGEGTLEYLPKEEYGFSESEIAPMVASQSDFIDDIGYDLKGASPDAIMGINNPFYSLATSVRYVVPEGTPYFTFSHLEFYFSDNGYDEPIILEVRKGGKTPEESTLLFAQEIHDNRETGTIRMVSLEEHLTFQTGEVFWATLIFPKGFDAPIVINETYENQSGRFFLSFDAGQSFSPMENVMGVSYLALKTRAYSAGKGWDMPFMTLDPDHGEIDNANTQLVNIALEASKLRNGLHTSQIKIKTNDNGRTFTVPVEFTVTGQEARVEANKTALEFGNCFIGETPKKRFSVLNSGLADATIDSISFSSEKFTTKEYAGTVIQPGHFTTINVQYTPDSAGLDTEHMIVYTSAGELEFPLAGSATEAPALNVTYGPGDITLNYGDTAHVELTFQNDGNYPLSFSLPQTIKDVKVGIEGQKDLGFGYHFLTANDERGPISGTWEEIEATGTDITSLLIYNKSTPITLGHEFAYYGNTFSQLYINENGVVAFNNPGSAVSVTRFVSNYSPVNGIGAFWHNLDVNKGGKIYWQTFEDRTIIEWKDVQSGYYGQNGTVTFQIALFKDGAIQLRYNDVSGASFIDWVSSVGFNNEAKDDGIQIAYLDGTLLKDDMVIEIIPPVSEIVKEASLQEGALMPGESQTVSFVIDPTIKPYYGGSYQVGLTINSNDPLLNKYTHTFNMTVLGEAMPKILQDSLNFTTMMAGDNASKSIELVNEGTQAMVLEGISTSNSVFSSIFRTAITIEPNESHTVDVTFRPTVMGDYSDSLTLTVDGADMSVPMTAHVLASPAAAFSETFTTINLNHGDSTEWNFTVNNAATEGDTELRYSLSAPSVDGFLRNKALPEYAGEDTKFGYIYRDSRTSADSADAYNWIEIKETGKQIYIEGQFAWSMVLPFDFPFYGESFNKLYIAADGFLGVKFPTGYYPTYVNSLPRANDEVAGIIAPFWADFDPMYSENGGVYYKMEDDRFIVQWENVLQYYRFDGLKHSTFQVIIHKDGRIKFQYKDIDEHKDVAAIGLESPNEKIGLSIKESYSPDYVKEDETAYTIYPPSYFALQNGESQTSNFIVDATNLNEGIYTQRVYVQSNDPRQNEKVITVNLNVTGTHAADITDSLAYGHTFIEEGVAVKEYVQDVWVHNTGTRQIQVKGFHFVDGTYKNSTNGLEVLRNSGASFFYTLNANKEFPYSYKWVKIQPGDSYNFQVRFVPTELGTISDTLYLRMEGTETIVKAIPVSATVSGPSTISANIEGVELNVLPTDTNDGSFGFSNTGSGMLEYMLTPVWRRPVDVTAMTASSMGAVDQTEFTADAAAFIKAAPIAPANVASSMMATTMEAEMINFTDSIHYDDDRGPNEIEYRSGLHGTQVFDANRFKAGEGGFALTHFRNFVYNENMPEASVKVEIRVGGSTPSEATPVYTQEFEIGGQPWGAWQQYEFDQTTFINPGEYFFILLEFDEQLDYPQGIYSLGYYAHNGEFFYSDNGGRSYKVTGFGIERRIRALSDATFDWLTLTPSEGEVSTDNETNISWATDASKAKPGQNSARVMVLNNDPNAEAVYFDIDMYVNRMPYFMMPVAVDTVYENTPATIELTVGDYEGETLQVSLAEETGFTSLNWNAETGLATVNVTAGYEAAGDYTLTVEAEDANGLKNSHEVMLHVVDVNRLPEITMENISFPFWSEYVIDQSLFTDADGDALDIDATINTGDTVAQVVMRGNEMVIMPFAQGTTTLTLMATDNRGEMVSKTVEVTVSGNNAPEVANLIDEQSVFLEDKTFAFDFSDVFMDADGHALAYTVSVSDSSAVDFVQTVDNRIIFTLNEATQVEVTITANDGYTSTSTHFMLTVNLPLAIDEELAAQIGLSNYPNPVSTSTTFSYSLVKGGNVAIEVTNLQGMVVKTIEIGDQSVGEYKSEFQADALPAGMYIYSLKLNGKVVSTGKMIKR
ncbi:S8 family serine peptidase [Limibacter armeniacum]|uniref:S8 family serine peptidase n=1 Tax=Limibacter armeniacum TaxID=466084 RepID=UPI002FE64284